MLGVDDVLKFGASGGICWLNGGWVMVVGCWLLSVDDVGISDKKRPKISCNPFIYYSFEQKTFR